MAASPNRWRRGLVIGLILVVTLPGLLLWLASWRTRVPSFAEVKANWTPSEAWLLDRHGEVLHSLRQDRSVRRLDWIPLAEISPALVNAIQLAEDRRFLTHGGLDVRALASALWQGLRDGRVRGASTLSMQLAGLLDPTLDNPRTGRTLVQKFRQAAMAVALERGWSKREILEAYLNLASFRGELQGVAANARALFDKHPSGLSESESILLAALLPAPNAGAERLRRRACAIAATGNFHNDCSSLSALVDATLVRLPGARLTDVNLAPPLAHRFLTRPGQRVGTTLDARWQRLARETLAQQLAGLQGRNVRDGAAVIVDNRSGEVLAYVGSAGPESTAGHVDGAAARRQAGSTLKPFLYGLALERRYLTPASLLEDSPVNLETATGLYIPQNYDHEFKGPVSVRTALASSLNVPAVRTLVLVGVEAFRDRLMDLGYAGLTESGEFYGFSLALGSGEVSLLEQVNAYRTLANGGLWSRLRLLPDTAEVTAPRRVMSATAAYLVADMLADNASRAVTFGLDSPLATRYWSSVKTGTSKDMRDNWCIGFSPRYTVGVWVGNFEGDAMQDVSGVSGAAPAWAVMMQRLHEAEAGVVDPPAVPPGLLRQVVAFEPPVEPARDEWFIAGTETRRVVGEARQHRPRIESPPDGVIIALDPDIPADNQRIWFTATRGDRAGFWLDERELGPAANPSGWMPVPGRHVLKLKSTDSGALLDSVEFQVRGSR